MSEQVFKKQVFNFKIGVTKQSRVPLINGRYTAPMPAPLRTDRVDFDLFPAQFIHRRHSRHALAPLNTHFLHIL